MTITSAEILRVVEDLENNFTGEYGGPDEAMGRAANMLRALAAEREAGSPPELQEMYATDLLEFSLFPRALIDLYFDAKEADKEVQLFGNWKRSREHAEGMTVDHLTCDFRLRVKE